MFNRPHHQRIAKILAALNSELLLEAECYFAGGTAIVLSLNEYRESVDIDFLCASTEGYRTLLNSLHQQELGGILREPVEHLREVKADRYGIRTMLSIDGAPIKVEFVREDRISLSGAMNDWFGVPVLDRSDMYAEKLLANADRGLDKYVKSRDLIDLAMMIEHWGDIPEMALEKVHGAYGEHVFTMLEKTIQLIQNESYFKQCLSVAHMDMELIKHIPAILNYQMGLIKNPKPAASVNFSPF